MRRTANGASIAHVADPAADVSMAGSMTWERATPNPGCQGLHRLGCRGRPSVGHFASATPRVGDASAHPLFYSHAAAP